MELKLSRSTVRNWRRGDEESVARHANNYKIWRNLRDMIPYPYTLADARRWIEKEASEASSTNYAIDVGGAAVGAIGLTLYDDVFRRSAEIGYWLGEEYWGKGIVTEAVQALTDYAFSNFDLRRIYAGVFEWNLASMRVLEKAGYQFEARLRKHVTKEGETIDQFIYAILRP
ncbi:MAG TPA: GNAT family N-acetyltransferase [Blastocatellia bacterium]|nr:GNAT family N-acetyltransferase [Blastocatellia bacterium]